MTQTTTTGGDLFARVLDPANRPDPYPLYAAARDPRSRFRTRARTW